MTDPTTRQGPVGTATRLPSDLINTPHTHAAWFLDLPPMHPVWPRYVLSLIDLQDDPAMPPPHRRFPEATWEIGIYALDPQRQPKAGAVDTWSALTPPNLIFHFTELDLAGAVQLTATVAQWCVEGQRWVESQGMLGERERWQADLEREVQALRTRASRMH